MTIEEAISKEEALAYSFGERYKRLGEPVGDLPELEAEHRQYAEWLRKLQEYEDLSTYNRENKCCECEYEDSEYYCDDCIWNFVDKFKQREVNADEDNSRD